MCVCVDCDRRCVVAEGTPKADIPAKSHPPSRRMSLTSTSIVKPPAIADGPAATTTAADSAKSRRSSEEKSTMHRHSEEKKGIRPAPIAFFGDLCLQIRVDSRRSVSWMSAQAVRAGVVDPAPPLCE